MYNVYWTAKYAEDGLVETDPDAFPAALTSQRE